LSSILGEAYFEFGEGMFHYFPFIKLGNVPQTQIASNEHSWGIKIRRIFFNFNKLAYDESGEGKI
jgi:hypothetical protein